MLDTVWTPLVLSIMKLTVPDLLITASDSLPVFDMSPLRFVNHFPGSSLIEKDAKFVYGDAPGILFWVGLSSVIAVFTCEDALAGSTLNVDIIPASI